MAIHKFQRHVDPNWRKCIQYLKKKMAVGNLLLLAMIPTLKNVNRKDLYTIRWNQFSRTWRIPRRKTALAYALYQQYVMKRRYYALEVIRMDPRVNLEC